jgi:hypothetical protein
MTVTEQIRRDLSTEVVLGLAEAFHSEVKYFCEDRDVRRAILAWAFSEGKLVHISKKFMGQQVYLDGNRWRFSDNRRAGFAALAHGWFLKLSDWNVWKIEYSKGEFFFSDGSYRVFPGIMLKIISDFEQIPQGRFLYREYKTRRKMKTAQIAAISFLQEAAELSPSAVLVRFNILAKDATVEILAIARLIFAIGLMANYKTKRETKP